MPLDVSGGDVLGLVRAQARIALKVSSASWERCAGRCEPPRSALGDVVSRPNTDWVCVRRADADHDGVWGGGWSGSARRRPLGNMSRKGVIMSTGNGNTTVEFWSAPNSNSVCR